MAACPLNMNYMRATQSSQQRSSAQGPGKKAIRQACLTEWNISGNIQRFATIGLISKNKHKLLEAAAVRQVTRKVKAQWNKENGAADDAEGLS